MYSFGRETCENSRFGGKKEKKEKKESHGKVDVQALSRFRQITEAPARAVVRCCNKREPIILSVRHGLRVGWP